RDPLHLARQALLIGAWMRPEDDAAAAIVRRADRALAGTAGALLPVGFLAAARDVAAVLGGARARPTTGQLRRDDLVQHGRIDGRGEERVGKIDGAHGGARPVVEGGLGHRQAFFTKIRAFREPGSVPLTSRRLRSASARTTRSFLTVVRWSPMWPAM